MKKNFNSNHFALALSLLAIVAYFTNLSWRSLNQTTKTYQTVLKTATDVEYPNNNMIGFKSKLDGTYTHKKVFITETENGNYDFTILPSNPNSDTLLVPDVNLLEFMPSIPENVKKNAYLSFLAVLNQEWNRIQVKFNNKIFIAKGAGTEKNIVTRVDIANNCIQKGLWELLTFTTDKDKDQLYFQCWFDFPQALYNKLFLKRNGVSIAAYDEILKNYSHAQGEKIDLNILRRVNNTKEIPFVGLNQGYYPLKGERETKLKNIIFPITVNSIDNLLTDSTTFATFAPPGQYTRADPRKTELSRFQNLEKAVLLQTTSTNAAATATSELQLFYTNHAKTKTTQYIIGGLELDKLPILNENTLHKGWQRPMGISNHSFYNSYEDLIVHSSLQNAYFSFLLDANGQWLDSHEIGIDGILLYREEGNVSKIHAFILAFERHAFVGHTVFEVPKTDFAKF
ncbi:MAG: hypothetical protein RLZZ628_250 [Bacteroidota bacterium]|jgi:hypothetical protein